MIRLYDAATGQEIGTLTETQLRFLIDRLEEESETDQDYYVNIGTLEMLQEAGADPQLVEILRRGLGNRDDMDVRWERTA